MDLVFTWKIRAHRESFEENDSRLELGGRWVLSFGLHIYIDSWFWFWVIWVIHWNEILFCQINLLRSGISCKFIIYLFVYDNNCSLCYKTPFDLFICTNWFINGLNEKSNWRVYRFLWCCFMCIWLITRNKSDALEVKWFLYLRLTVCNVWFVFFFGKIIRFLFDVLGKIEFCMAIEILLSLWQGACPLSFSISVFLCVYVLSSV